MKVFFTTATQHLADHIDLPKGACEISRFKDGEIFMQIHDSVAHQQVWVVAATNAPAEHLLELFLMLDALQRMHARINLLITYFGYARQDRAEHGQALSAEVISKFLKMFTMHKIVLVQVHSNALVTFLRFSNQIPYDFFYQACAAYDMIVAPDHGALAFAETIARHTGKGVAYIEKVRLDHDRTKVIELHGQVAGKSVVIVDDIISTGGTICNAAEILLKQGANSVAVVATHGIFADDVIQRLRDHVGSVIVTNTLPQQEVLGFLQVYNIGPFLESIICNTDFIIE